MIDQEKFTTNLQKTIEKMILLANNEEHKIGSFIGVTQKSSYKLFRTIIWPIYFIGILGSLMMPTFNLENDWFEMIIVISFYIIQMLGLKYVKYSHSFYAVVRKRFSKYQKQLKLITNNSNIHNFIKENKELKMKNDLVNQKFDYILRVLKTPLEFVKTIEIVGVISLTISTFISLFQNLQASIVIINNIDNIVAFIILILVLYVSPILLYNRSAGFKDYRKGLRENLNSLRSIQRLNLIEAKIIT